MITVDCEEVFDPMEITTNGTLLYTKHAWGKDLVRQCSGNVYEVNHLEISVCCCSTCWKSQREIQWQGKYCVTEYNTHDPHATAYGFTFLFRKGIHMTEAAATAGTAGTTTS